MMRGPTGGIREAFRVLVERYQKLVYTLALRLVSNPPTGEDVAQEAFIRLEGGCPNSGWTPNFPPGSTGSPSTPPPTCCGGGRRSRPTTVWRTSSSPSRCRDRALGPEEQAQAAERRAILQRAIASLTENHAENPCLLREVNGLTTRRSARCWS